MFWEKQRKGCYQLSIWELVDGDGAFQREGPIEVKDRDWAITVLGWGTRGSSLFEERSGWCEEAERGWSNTSARYFGARPDFVIVWKEAVSVAWLINVQFSSLLARTWDCCKGLYYRALLSKVLYSKTGTQVSFKCCGIPTCKQYLAQTGDFSVILP